MTDNNARRTLRQKEHRRGYLATTGIALTFAAVAGIVCGFAVAASVGAAMTPIVALGCVAVGLAAGLVTYVGTGLSLGSWMQRRFDRRFNNG